MKYSRETIEKAVRMLKTKVDDFQHESNLGIVISKGNKKIGNTLNVSLAPVLTCPNCSHCIAYCYDIKAVMLYGNVLNARAKNTALLLRSRDDYFGQIEKAINGRKKNKFFRWHVSGDIVDIDYFARMCEVAKKHPDFRMWTYTKNYSAVNAYCAKYGRSAVPENLSVMFSKWEGLAMDNPYNFPVFAVVMKGQDKPHNVKWCCGNCNECIRNCSHCVKGENVYCMEH